MSRMTIEVCRILIALIILIVELKVRIREKVNEPVCCQIHNPLVGIALGTMMGGWRVHSENRRLFAGMSQCKHLMPR